jgi:hypothetical protein
MNDKSTDATVIEYEFVCDEAYWLEAYARHRQQRKTRYWFLPLKFICAVGLLALIALCVFAKVYFVAVLVGLIAVLLLASPKIDPWLTKRRMRKSPLFGLRTHITLSEAGFADSDEKSRTQLAWSVFRAVRRFPDGFMLFSGPWIFYWLPDKGLKSGTVSMVEELVRKHVN